MADIGVAVAAARRDMVARLQQAASRRSAPFPRRRWPVTGTVEDWLAEQPALAAEDDLRAGWPTRASTVTVRLQARARAAAPSGRTAATCRFATGPKNMPAEVCSTGEQKALLIAIVLAHARLMAAERGRAPLILLDEVAAHLDAERRDGAVRRDPGAGRPGLADRHRCQPSSPLGDAARFLPCGGRSCHDRPDAARDTNKPA